MRDASGYDHTVEHGPGPATILLRGDADAIEQGVVGEQRRLHRVDFLAASRFLLFPELHGDAVPVPEARPLRLARLLLALVALRE